MPISTAVDPAQVSRVVGIETNFVNLNVGAVNYLPQRIAVVGQGSTASTYSLTKAQVFSPDAVGATYGYGSPLHLAVRQLLPVSGDGVGNIPVTVYPLEDNASGVVGTGDIEATVTTAAAATYWVKVNNVLSQAFNVAVGDVAGDVHDKIKVALDASVSLPILAGTVGSDVPVTSKWKGASAGDVVIEIVGPTDKGVTFAITQLASAAVNPNAAEINAALAQIGNVWETLVLNLLDVADTTALDTYAAFGEGRWGALVNKPLLVFSGDTNATVAAAIAVPDARKTDRVNCQLVSPGSNDLPFVSAARQLARIAVTAQKNPPRDYGSQIATGLTAGIDSVQWNGSQREAAVLGGSSTVQPADGVLKMSDTITFYHPSGEAVPPYRFVCDHVKLWQVLYNLDLIFNNPNWDGAPLVPDGQAHTNPDAKRPSTAVAAVAALIDSLGRAAIISDPETAKESIQAGISESNGKRLDISLVIQLAGNANIISITNNFGFFFGTVEAA
ncbi:MAG: phage tail protein [FCB group bacterium]|nr:phage tail protein [FCB group bacterium]